MNTLKHIIYTNCSCILKKLITILNNKNYDNKPYDNIYYNIKSHDNNCYDNIYYNQYVTSQLINREFKINEKNKINNSYNDSNNDSNNDNFDFEIISKNEYENTKMKNLNNIQIIKFM